MPLLRLTIASAELPTEQATQLQAGLTKLMADILHKRADLTVVAIDHAKPMLWARGGVALPSAGWSASLEVFVTAGTNTAKECADFIAAAHHLIGGCWLHAADTPVYIVINEVSADSWGYDGQTQMARRGALGVATPQTLSAMSGRAEPAPPTTHDGALLMIDFQREYADGRLPLRGLADAVGQAQALLAAADAAGMPIIHIHHESASAAAPWFAPGSAGAEPLSALPVLAQHHRIVKQWPSAFMGTPLLPLLQQLGVKHVVLAGLMTHNCVDSTAREAMHLGYGVTVVSDACATRDLPDLSGGVLLAEQVHINSLSALADRHAQVFDTKQVTAAWAVSSNKVK